jgi:diadenosine tetraphosphate (Ap4A) HIT family hydrolase
MTTSCLFCRPGDPTLNQVLAENDTCYARWDNYPANSGHVEVVTRRHTRSLFDLTCDEATDMWQLLRLAREVVEVTHGAPDGWTVGVNDGPAAGQTVPHVHVHLIPRHHGDVPDPRGGIRQCAPNNNPDAWSRPRPGAEKG